MALITLITLITLWTLWTVVILGLDPGSARAGYGLIKKEGGKLTHIASGILKFSPDPLQRLPCLEKNLKELLKIYKPEKAGIEQLFFVNNQKTALEVAQSRGVLINTLIKNAVSLVEMTPAEVKKAVTSDGSAPKKAVAKMVNLILGKNIKALDDETDALAIAIAASNVIFTR